VSWASLASASILSLLAPLLGERLPVAVFSAAALALGCLYCLRPARLCGRPGFDFLTNAFGFGFVAFGVGWYLSGASLQIRILAAEALPYFLLMCGGSISSTVCDIDGDREARKLTTAVVLGPAPAHSLALLFVAAGAALGVARGDLSSAAAGLLSSAIYVACSMLRRQSVCEATYKVGGGILMVMAAAHAPVFAAVSCGVLIATRMYFRLRHHVTYPSLVPSRT
jgi:1,4-dihydroxy-2-naphthoate octaprenyltransferase